MRPAHLGLLLLTACLVFATGCSRSSTITDQRKASPVAIQSGDMANACYALQSVGQKAYAEHRSDGSFFCTIGAAGNAEPIYMKPTALGKYMLYTKNQKLMAVSGSGVASADTPSDAADWTVQNIDDKSGLFTIYSASASKALIADSATGQLKLGDGVAAGDNQLFRFTPADGCSDYPEPGVNALGDAYTGDVNKPVVGMAEVHLHVSATDFLGGGHYGRPFSRFGVTDALGNCSVVHGPDGHLDVVGNLLANTPLAGHDTVGWPTFTDWPAAGSLMHEGTYYKWIERAWKAGLRIMVNNLVENQVLCTLESTALQLHPGQDCNEMNSATRQAQFMKDMQDYIDAQNGGKGKGWFRIVENPKQAREVIAQGKLAVVLGIEISHLFNCNVVQPLGAIEVDGCTAKDIDDEIEALHKLGVREMFPIHEFDNALGGNGIFDGLVLNVGNAVDTGKFWKTYDCPAGDYVYDPGAIMTTSDPSGATDPAWTILRAAVGDLSLPIYPHTRQCNTRWMTDLGKHAFQQMMNYKMIIELDHLELKMKDQVLDMAEQQDPLYPVVSTHGGHGGISTDQGRRILASGGILYPGANNGKQWVDFLHKIEPLQSPKYAFGMGFGKDMNGLAHQAGPRGGDSQPLQYPFTLFKGPGWGAKFNGIAPVVFDHEVSGQRSYDIDVDGLAHYGLIPDFVEEVRIEGGEEAINALYNSAEVYIEMWERTLNRSSTRFPGVGSNDDAVAP